MLMNVLYLILALVALYAECSKSVDTRSLIIKGFLFSIITGSILGMNNIQNNLVVLGIIGYVIVYFFKYIQHLNKETEEKHYE